MEKRFSRLCHEPKMQPKFCVQMGERRQHCLSMLWVWEALHAYVGAMMSHPWFPESTPQSPQGRGWPLTFLINSLSFQWNRKKTASNSNCSVGTYMYSLKQEKTAHKIFSSFFFLKELLQQSLDRRTKFWVLRFFHNLQINISGPHQGLFRTHCTSLQWLTAHRSMSVSLCSTHSTDELLQQELSITSLKTWVLKLDQRRIKFIFSLLLFFQYWGSSPGLYTKV